MSIQMTLIPSEAQVAAQKRLLAELIELKAQSIEVKAYHNFWGTPEACQAKVAEVNGQVQRFVAKVTSAFPGVMIDTN